MHFHMKGPDELHILTGGLMGVQFFRMGGWNVFLQESGGWTLILQEMGRWTAVMGKGLKFLSTHSCDTPSINFVLVCEVFTS